MTRAELLLLQDKLQITRSERRPDLLRPETDDRPDEPGRYVSERIEHVPEQRLAQYRLQHFRGIGMHPRPLSGR